MLVQIIGTAARMPGRLAQWAVPQKSETVMPRYIKCKFDYILPDDFVEQMKFWLLQVLQTFEHNYKFSVVVLVDLLRFRVEDNILAVEAKVVQGPGLNVDRGLPIGVLHCD